MIQGLDASSKQFLTNLNTIQRRVERAQQQLSSGKRINTASDDPGQVSALLQTRAQLRQAERTEQNLGIIQGEVNTGESVVSQALTLVERAQVLAAKGATSFQTAEARTAAADEVDGLIEQMVTLSQTQYNDRYLFAGDSDQTVPYTLDWTQATPLSSYQGSASTRMATTPSGAQFRVALTAEEIFGNADPEKNVFAALTALSQALTDNDQDAIDAAAAQLDTAGDHLNTKLSFYGTAQNRVADALDEAADLQLNLTTKLSGIEDADMTEAILELNMSKYQQEAALASWSQVPRSSLFDYLG